MAGAEFEGLSVPELRELVSAWQERERRKDLRFGILTTVLAECNRDHKTRPQPFQPADFYSSLEVQEREQFSEEQLLEQMETYAARMSAMES